ncbi:glutathione S-transferase family protein [Pseudoprimorskyibacter insulae]|uniref:Putative GST-like protein YibF n=1 Tax=Pseudoprimorskyibacter insulae TaxID=1695997 RepID=A0A2R8AQA5_9RHOB|nr:glutathione S-transferase family protein [Pseudoprimorskyibacter insulae]SPF78160.1 putative GST-like protein YibF [Pseudoprimorskyibacter insulae]
MRWRLYSSSRSPFVRKVMIAAHELGLQDRIERVDVVTTPMTPAPEVLPYNPLGMIPVLVDSETPYFDSLVILEFLDAQAGGGLYPDADRHDCTLRHSVADGAMEKAVKLLDETFRTQNSDTEEHIKGFAASIKAAIQWMEPRLKPGRFDAGDITYAALMAYLDMRFPQFLWVDQAPKSEAFMQSLIDRPSMVQTAFGTPPFV